jgi:hypothetical protein
MKRKTTKDLAQRIDPQYHRHRHRLRRARLVLGAGAVGVSALWVAVAWAAGDETAYMPGPVARSHALFEEDCAKCHAERFGPIRDAACLDCHAEAPHVPPGKGRDPACASCHREHRGREALAAVADGHCAPCHADHAGITSFANHRDFAPKPRDQRLRFPHAKHLAPDLLEGPLDCGSCHVPEAGNFAAISFDAHCARCHQERIDRPLAAETVPHGFQPDAIRDWVAAVYVRRTDASKEALARAEAAANALFEEGRGCLLCHVREGAAIAEPRIPRSWMNRARFSHETHRFEPCSKCHDMSGNAAAETLSLPGIATCRECHRDAGARTSCVSCHDYHR